MRATPAAPSSSPESPASSSASLSSLTLIARPAPASASLASSRESLSSPRSSRKRPRSPLRLSISASCPHLPYLVAGTSSPPAVTSALAFGLTASPSYSPRTRSRPEDASSRPANPRRMSAGFPWDSRPTTGRISPAIEVTESLVRQSRPATPPHPLFHSVSDPASGGRESRSSAKSSLRLELPPRIDDPFGRRAFPTSPRHHGDRFVGQPLLNFAYPATPDIGMNNVPVICEGTHEENLCPSRDGDHGTGQMDTQHLLQATRTHMRGGLNLLTPPDDSGVLDWRQSNVSGNEVDGVGANMYDHESAREGQSQLLTANPHSAEEAKMLPGQAEETSEQSSSGVELPSERSTRIEVRSNKEALDRPTRSDTLPEEEDWLASATTVLVGSSLQVSTATEAVRVLSYSLPCPLPTPEVDVTAGKPGRLPASAVSAPYVAAAAGQQLSPSIMEKCTSRPRGNSGSSSPSASTGQTNQGITTALHSVTAAIHQRYSAERSSRVHIHISHAIEPRTALSRLPSTPPLTGGPSSAANTPGTDVSAGGYFAPSVFNSIVIAGGSQTTTPTSGVPYNTAHPPLALPSPNPILPPSSLHVTLLERYIPPVSPAEDAAMFSPKSSILVDRLFELSPHGGSLLFIYPTKAGAESFHRDYLGPVLDPLLRRLMVLYMLREELLWGIRDMKAVSRMSNYDDLHNKVKRFIRAMARGDQEQQKTPIKLIYASKATVQLNEISWREWWTQQEQQRIRELVKTHFANLPTPASSGQTGSSNSGSSAYSVGYGVPGDLAREVLDGVRAPAVRPSSRGMGEAVLASSMSGTGSSGGDGGCAGAGPAGMTLPSLDSVMAEKDALRRKGVEVGVFILRRGVDSAVGL